MKRTIETLNEMSFTLPEGWNVVEDKYRLINGQGFINTENYISENGEVLSLFEIQRDPDEFFESYQSLVEGYKMELDGIELAKQSTLTVNEFEFPVYILEGNKESTIYIAHIFINCGDCLGCFIFQLKNFSSSVKELISKNKIFSDVTKILRTVE
ncbi:MAG: hypothetical protein J6K97_00685 [Clostridia bacterium]|nr:hypothetical protein [Clostridia bacterium]